MKPAGVKPYPAKKSKRSRPSDLRVRIKLYISYHKLNIIGIKEFEFS